MTRTMSRSIIARVLAGLVALWSVDEAFALDAPRIARARTGHGKQAIVVTAGPSGLPHGFTVRWMDAASFAAAGAQWSDGTTPGEHRAAFTGAPTLNTFNGQYRTFRLGPNETVMIEIGDLLQETGVDGDTGELEAATAYHYVAFANDAAGAPASALSNTVDERTIPTMGCNFPPGFWKDTKERWPVETLTLGGVSYARPQLCNILETSARGNGLVSLAHQLIAARLNVARGNSVMPGSVLDACDAQIRGQTIPPFGGGHLDPAATAGLTQILDDFNNGMIWQAFCTPVSIETSTWGAIKARYRLNRTQN